MIGWDMIVAAIVGLALGHILFLVIDWWLWR